MNTHQNRLEEIISRLREEGHRLTPQRMAILEVLIGDRHPSIPEIYDQVRVDYPMMSQATVYSTVSLLKEMGEVVELNFGEGCSRYDDASSPSHPHLICTECGRIVDLDADLVGELPQEVARRTGYHVVHHQLDFFGICPHCQGEA